MALQIKAQDQVFSLSGRLTANNVFSLKQYLEHKLKTFDSIIVCLSGLDDLDLSGAMLLQDLKTVAFSQNKQITVQTRENKKIMGAFSALRNQHVLAA